MRGKIQRDKLGLALAGGGFRASLFHVGVFKRLAELDLLRKVETISSVSGGSIVAALYILLLKAKMENPNYPGNLSQADYADIVTQLEKRLCLGIQQDLRNRLFFNPFSVFKGFTSGDNLSRVMAALYDQHIFKSTIDEINPKERPGDGIYLKDIKINPGGQSLKDRNIIDIEAYNTQRVMENTSVITKLVLNATSMNTGCRFWFTASELGESEFGYLHYMDIGAIEQLKPIIDKAKASGVLDQSSIVNAAHGRTIAWWLSKGDCRQLPPTWNGLFQSWINYYHHDVSNCDNLNALLECNYGSLRDARRSAWIIYSILSKIHQQHAIEWDIDQAKVILATKLGIICHQYTESVVAWLDKLRDHELCELYEFINDIYLVRSADQLEYNVKKYFETEVKLSDAVAASANFPPVFSPYQITQLYDNFHVSRLGLTDGGVYDNLGVIALLEEGCNYIISSDTGASRDHVHEVSTGRIGMMGRILSVLMDDGLRLTREFLMERHRVSSGLDKLPCTADLTMCPQSQEEINNVHLARELHGLAAFKIDSSEIRESEKKLNKPYKAKDLAKIRTDLDAFGDIEMDALIDQGYINSGMFLRRWFAVDFNNHYPEHLVCRYENNENDYSYHNANFATSFQPIPRACDKDYSDPYKSQVINVASSRFPRIFRLWRSGILCGIAWASLFTLVALLVCNPWATSATVNIPLALQNSLTELLMLKPLGLAAEVNLQHLILTLLVLAIVVAAVLFVIHQWQHLIEKARDKNAIKLTRFLSVVARLPRTGRAFIWVVVIRLIMFFVSLLAHFYTRLYLFATNRGRGWLWIFRGSSRKSM